MSDYPDENEEYELMYQDELELMNEMHDAETENHVPNLNNKSLANSQHSVASELANSPQLSQISCVNRRLFGTPLCDGERGASTPVTGKQRLAPINELINLDSEPLDAIQELQQVGLRSKRRLDKELYADCAGLYGHESYDDPLAKKARTEETRDLEDIARIKAFRSQMLDGNKAVRKDNLSRLKAQHEFKKQNLSARIPNWPFLMLKRSDQTRIFVRFHSADYETNSINSIQLTPSCGGLLNVNKQQMWVQANEIFLRKTTASSDDLSIIEPATVDATEADLWVDKYKPRKYIELLSDELTNRSLLYWLKMWDKCVFRKERKLSVRAIANPSKLNSFNKKSGRFESTGGWTQRKYKPTLNTEIDELGRPAQKVALLCGPPGLGKTTLAHTIATHAGYNVREVNASDDRNPDAFKEILENCTQNASLSFDGRPNCIILDEIDGAPRASIEYLVKFVSDKLMSKTQKKGVKSKRQILKRPIICICNDAYDPALRPLRQIAFIVTCPPIDSMRLEERLLEIAHQEGVKTAFGALISLVEKTGGDVRSCISTLQFFGAQKKPLTLLDVQNTALGQKDRHRGLFDIWSIIFRFQSLKKQIDAPENSDDAPQFIMDMSATARVNCVLEAVHSDGNYERLMQGVFENYLHQKMSDPDLKGVIEALQWFELNDMLQHQINQQQNYATYAYLQYGFAMWHLLFASLGWPKINFPTHGIEFTQKCAVQRNIFQTFRKGISPALLGLGHGVVILTDAVPLLKFMLTPNVRSVAVQLLSSKEHKDLQHTIDIMLDLGLCYIEVRNADGNYMLQMEPDLETLAKYPGFNYATLNYFGKQLISREVELERIRRMAPKSTANSSKDTPTTSANAKQLPNHLRKLEPKRLGNNANVQPAKEVISKDFFGRIQHNAAAANIMESILDNDDPVVKSPIWYRFKEGFNNAVRRDVHLKDLI